MSASILSLLLFTFLIVGIVVQATVPASQTFTFVNEGDYGEYETEYGANYRLLLQAPNIALCFYNTTPGAYTLGLRMGSRPEDSTFNIMRWYWAANRGHLVGENATLTFSTDGNLILADADGTVAWQTATANKGVVGIEVLENGNLVLVDDKGGYVWQSFDYPTDSLLVGQGLQSAGVKELVSRVSPSDGSNGPFRFVLEKSRLSLYLNSRNSPNPILYYTTGNFEGSTIDRVVFNSVPETEEAFAYELSYDFYIDNNTSPASIRLARPKYNTTLSFLRLDFDGNIRIYTYYDKVIFGSWDVTYILFNRDGTRSLSECKLPTRCGSFGVCMNNQCVGCPSRNGLLWWNESCASPTLVVCKNGESVNAKYYKVEGVEHFTSDYTEGEGPFKVSECRVKCSDDCGCLGFFYKEESSKCLLAYELGPLTKVSNASHVAYIKR